MVHVLICIVRFLYCDWPHFVKTNVLARCLDLLVRYHSVPWCHILGRSVLSVRSLKILWRYDSRILWSKKRVFPKAARSV